MLLALQGRCSIIAFIRHILVLFYQTTGQLLDRRVYYTADEVIVCYPIMYHMSEVLGATMSHLSWDGNSLTHRKLKRQRGYWC